jgi:hypothetical protein
MNMKKYLAVVALAAALTQPASAITFPSLTTIYVGSGVADSGTATGSATTFHCTNVSGVSTSVRFLVLRATGAVAASATLTVAHGATVTTSTHGTFAYGDSSLVTGGLFQGAINIESFQSGVFCNAVVVDSAASTPLGVPLPLVRINPHPGTVE